jgi:DNA modification methylase
VNLQLPERPFNIIAGDASQILEELPGESVDTLFTSPTPPLDAITVSDLCKILDKARPVLKNTGSMWIHISDFHNPETGSMRLVPQTFVKQMVEEYHWILRSDIIWHRPIKLAQYLESRGEDNRFYRDYDHLLWFTKSKNDYYVEKGRMALLMTSIIRAALVNEQDNYYGYLMPLNEVFRPYIDIVTPRDGTVLDCFCGSGTTADAVFDLRKSKNLKFIGIEWNPIKVPKTISRLISSMTKKQEMQDVV